jgi:hypothetical protein
MAMTNDRAVVADPASGKYVDLSRSEFDQTWRQEYLPVFRPADDEISIAQARKYLKSLGYQTDDTVVAIRSFQTDMGMQATGQLDSQTVLLLTGQFIKDAPTLDEKQFAQDVLRRMNCLDNPQACPW